MAALWQMSVKNKVCYNFNHRYKNDFGKSLYLPVKYNYVHFLSRKTLLKSQFIILSTKITLER
jgi:hypothetical protein